MFSDTRYILLVLLGFFILSFTTCGRSGPERKSGYKKLKRSVMLSTFSHKKHNKYFEQEKIYCSNCHFMQFSLEGKRRKDRGKLSSELLYPGMEECHYCHENKKYENAAPQECLLCHVALSGMMPDNHRVDWINRHKSASRIEDDCAKCHRDNYCSDCHLKRDTIRQRVHDRNYLYAHSIEARANPRKCVSCHTASYCLTCHIERGITR